MKHNVRLSRVLIPLEHHACTYCSPSRVNGVLVHERGCPVARVGTRQECRWCGSAFTVEADDPHRSFCSPCCAAAHCGGECQCDACLSRCVECGSSDRVLLDGMGGDRLCWDCRHGDGAECNAGDCRCGKVDA